MKVLAVLGGRSPNVKQLQKWAAEADVIYAADSGADVCLSAGLAPIVTGDMDSVTQDLSGLRVVPNPDQNTSDCDKLLQLVHQEIPNAIVAIAGYEGDRFDHMLANLTSFAISPLSIQILLQTGIAYVLRENQTFNNSVAEGKIVSLIPITHSLVTLKNCQWPLQQEPMQLHQRVSISNVAHKGFTATLHQGTALLIVTGKISPFLAHN